ncbi:MAG: DUF2231 domain-containing protein [Rhodocyclales bacterium]|nr:DUF2231 domain-containing protein [Rhodocyclales bacterium]
MKRVLRLAGHPLHPALVHFPVALWSMTLVWDILWQTQGQALWGQLGYWSLAAGLALALPAMAAGMIDLAAIGDNPAAEKAAMRHMAIMSIAAAVALANLLLRHGNPAQVTPLQLALSSLCLVLLVAGAWYGGELVYRHGAGCIE